MLAAIEDLLDSFAGTLLVVSHDRYLIERVTDQQYAVMDGHLRHLPGGVDQYLALRKGVTDAGAAEARPSAPAGSAGIAAKRLGGAELRNAQKELAALDRRIAKLGGEIAAVHTRLGEHDQSDYAGLGILTTELHGLEAALAGAEERWLELSALLE
jgi:hypothetical protein